MNTLGSDVNMEVILAKPRGFCAGVKRAITIVREALEKYGPPVYVLHEIVHNTHVIRELAEKGVVFVESPGRYSHRVRSHIQCSWSFPCHGGEG